MIKFEELQLNQNVIVVLKCDYGEPFKIYNGIVIVKGQAIPRNYFNEKIDDKPYIFIKINYGDRNKLLEIDNYKTDHEKYLFFSSKNEFKKEIGNIIEQMSKDEIKQIEEETKRKIQEVSCGYLNLAERMIKQYENQMSKKR